LTVADVSDDVAKTIRKDWNLRAGRPYDAAAVADFLSREESGPLYSRHVRLQAAETRHGSVVDITIRRASPGSGGRRTGAGPAKAARSEISLGV